MLKGAAMYSAEGRECHSAERRTCSSGCILSHFQILMNSAAVTPISRCRRRGYSDGSCRRCRVLLQSAEVQGAVCATMDPAEGTGSFCWMLPCRVPCVQRKIRALAFTNASGHTVHYLGHASIPFRTLLLVYFSQRLFERIFFSFWRK